MRLGELDRYIAIEAPLIAINSFGEEETIWEIIYEGWASKYTKISDERYEANQKVNFELTVFTIHYEPNIKATFRIIEEDVMYEILGVKEVGYKEGLQLFTKTKDNYDF